MRSLPDGCIPLSVTSPPYDDLRRFGGHRWDMETFRGIADELWRALTGGFYVHAADWPTPTGAHDPALATQVESVRRLVGLGRAARTDAKMKTRQPLRRALLLHPGVELDAASRAEVESELNVKVAESIEGLGGIVSWTAVPNFRTLGPRLGPRVNEVKAALAADGRIVR